MADLTTLGVTFHYGVETAKGTKPTAFTWLKRCNSIGGISLDTEQIDVSALEDFITQYASGRQDTGGTWDVTFNLNADVITALKKLMSDAATGKTKGFRVWFEVVFPDLADAFFVIADPGKIFHCLILDRMKLQQFLCPLSSRSTKALTQKLSLKNLHRL